MADIFDEIGNSDAPQSGGDIFDTLDTAPVIDATKKTDIVDRATAGIQSLISSRFGGGIIKPETVTPEAMAKRGNWVQAGIAQSGKDLLAIPGSFFNQMAFNAPRSIENTLGLRSLSETNNAIAKPVAGISGFKGLIGNSLSQLGTRAFKKLAGERLRRKILTGAAIGAMEGAAYSPTQNFFDTEARANQIKTGTALGFASPIIAAGGQRVLGGIGKGLGYIKKSAADYVTRNVAPKAYQYYQDAVNNFTPQIQEFAKKLNITPEAIASAKKFGIEKTQQIRQLYQDSTDPIFQKIEQGFANVRKMADTAYSQAMNQAPEGKSINIRPAIEEAGKRLKKLGLITENGTLTQLGKSEIAKDSVYSRLLDFYQSADSISGVKGLSGKPLTQGQMIKVMKADRETLVNKDQYTFLRDKLNALYKNKPSDVDVGKVVNQFYSDGESSGIKGLQAARELQRKAFQAEENLYSKGLLKEGKLDKFQQFSEAEKRQLREIEKYIGQNFVDDLDALTADRALDKLREYNPDRFANDLNKAIDPKWTEDIYQKYRAILGDKQAREIVDEVIGHRRGIKIRKVALAGGAGLIGLSAAGSLGNEFRKKITGNY
jgi:hypothetical protein